MHVSLLFQHRAFDNDANSLMKSECYIKRHIKMLLPKRLNAIENHTLRIQNQRTWICINVYRLKISWLLSRWTVVSEFAGFLIKFSLSMLDFVSILSYGRGNGEKRDREEGGKRTGKTGKNEVENENEVLTEWRIRITKSWISVNSRTTVIRRAKWKRGKEPKRKMGQYSRRFRTNSSTNWHSSLDSASACFCN